MSPDLVEVAPIYVRELSTPRTKLEKNSIAYGMAGGLDPNTKTIAYIGRTPFDVQKATDGTITISEKPVSFVSPLVEPAGMQDNVFWQVYQEERWYNFHYGYKHPVEDFKNTALRGMWAVGIQFHSDNVVRVFLTTDGKDWAWNKVQTGVDASGKPLYEGWELSRVLELYETGENGRYIWTRDMDIIAGAPPQPFEGYYVLDSRTGSKSKIAPMALVHNITFPYLPGNDKIERRTWVLNISDLAKNETYSLMGVFTIGSELGVPPQYWAFGWPLSLQTGRLKVTSNPPGVTLLISGMPGTFSTPYEQDISPGTYTLTFQRNGYTDGTLIVTVPPAKTAEVYFDYAEALATGKVTATAPAETKFTIWEQKPLLEQIWDFFTDPEVAEYATPLIWEKAGLGAAWDAIDWISTTFGVAFPTTESAAEMMARGETPPEGEVRHILIIGPMGTEKIIAGSGGQLTAETAEALLLRVTAKDINFLLDQSITQPTMFNNWVAGLKPGQVQTIFTNIVGKTNADRLVFAFQEAAKSRAAAALAKQPWYAALDPRTKTGLTLWFSGVLASISLGGFMPWAVKEGEVESIVYPMVQAIRSGDYETARAALDRLTAIMGDAQIHAGTFAWLNPLAKPIWDTMIANWGEMLPIYEEQVEAIRPLPEEEVLTGFYFSAVPTGAIVMVDGVVVDHSKLVTVAPDVSHTIKATLEGYDTFEEDHTAREGYPTTVKVFMPKTEEPFEPYVTPAEPTYIAFTNVIPGSTVTLNGVSVDYTSLIEVEPGSSHTARAELSGYESWEKTSTAIPEQTTRFDVFMREIEVPPVPRPTEALLIIDSKPDEAQVWIGGEDTGETTHFERLLAKGTYTVVLKLPGFKDKPATAFISPPDDTVLSLAMDEEEVPINYGSIEVITTPPGADIYLDGLLHKWPSNTVLDNLEARTYTVEVELRGHEKQMQEVQVIEEEQVPARFKLVEIPAEKLWRVVVQSTPRDADITVDGVLTGRRTPGYVILRSGGYTIGVELYGFEPAQQTITLGAG